MRKAVRSVFPHGDHFRERISFAYASGKIWDVDNELLTVQGSNVKK